jgi:hypothetical protein
VYLPARCRSDPVCAGAVLVILWRQADLTPAEHNDLLYDRLKSSRIRTAFLDR